MTAYDTMLKEAMNFLHLKQRYAEFCITENLVIDKNKSIIHLGCNGEELRKCWLAEIRTVNSSVLPLLSMK